MNPAEINLNPLSQQQFDPVVMIAVIIIFAITLLVLRRVFVMPFVRVMEQRDEYLEVADAQVAEADSVVRDADFDAERALAEAAQAAEELRAHAREGAEASRRERIAEATRLASERLERGRAEIAAARANEVSALRSQAVDCVGVACVQLLGAESDGAAIEAAVDRLMARRIQ